MTVRLSYPSISPGPFRALVALSQQITATGLPSSLIDLVHLRVSQINGCAYCVDLHFGDLSKADVSPRKLNALVTWRESPFFSARERAALAWAESVTRIDRTGAPDEAYADFSAHFTEKERVDLTFAVAAMNAWNRLAISFRTEPSAA